MGGLGRGVVAQVDGQGLDVAQEPVTQIEASTAIDVGQDGGWQIGAQRLVLIHYGPGKNVRERAGLAGREDAQAL